MREYEYMIKRLCRELQDAGAIKAAKNEIARAGITFYYDPREGVPYPVTYNDENAAEIFKILAAHVRRTKVREGERVVPWADNEEPLPSPAATLPGAPPGGGEAQIQFTEDGLDGWEFDEDECEWREVPTKAEQEEVDALLEKTEAKIDEATDIGEVAAVVGGLINDLVSMGMIPPPDEEENCDNCGFKIFCHSDIHAGKPPEELAEAARRAYEELAKEKGGAKYTMGDLVIHHAPDIEDAERFALELKKMLHADSNPYITLPEIMAKKDEKTLTREMLIDTFKKVAGQKRMVEGTYIKRDAYAEREHEDVSIIDFLRRRYAEAEPMIKGREWKIQFNPIPVKPGKTFSEEDEQDLADIGGTMHIDSEELRTLGSLEIKHMPRLVHYEPQLIFYPSEEYKIAKLDRVFGANIVKATPVHIDVEPGTGEPFTLPFTHSIRLTDLIKDE